MTRSRITLPEIMLGPLNYGAGFALQLLRPSRTVAVASVEQVAIGPKSKADCLVLEDGERVVLTDKTRLEMPSGVDGVLRELSDGTYKWLSHNLIIEANDDVTKNGLKSRSEKAASLWPTVFRYVVQDLDKDGKPIRGSQGLRPPQVGALYAIGAHWSLHRSPATIVMPTGTGKTETMLSVLAAQRPGRLAVAVPSKALRNQTARKFLTFGLLQQLHLLPKEIPYPVVGILSKQPSKKEELALFDDCNVVIAAMPSFAGGSAQALGADMANRSDVLIVDEAHHVAAKTWTDFRAAFSDKRVLQFTATPFREDGKLVDGDVIFSYPLRRAQDDGYFKPIQFLPVYELGVAADDAIADTALEQLRKDIKDGYPHLMMARCDSQKRAEEVWAIYNEKANELNPLIIHSGLKDSDARVEKLKAGESRIAVCVNMLGEGFDLPRLKIAALHDPQKSLGPLLQFTGRFTRTSSENLGDATIVANIADPNVSEALERLYSEDSDWNGILSELSSKAAKDHAELIEFLNASDSLADIPEGAPNVSHQLLRPLKSTLVYECSTFSPKKFHDGLPKDAELVRVWLNNKTSTLFFVTRAVGRVRWSRSKEIIDVKWHLFVLHHDAARGLLYLGSSDKKSMHEPLARAVGATEQLKGEPVFRSLGGIGRLVFTNLGVSKHGRKNLSFAMYTGQNVREALGITEKKGARKAVLYGTGWENGQQIAFGCSYKGRVWTRDPATIPQFVTWAEGVGRKLLDTSIDTKDIIDHVLIPEEVAALPATDLMGIEWPSEMIRQEDRVTIISDGAEYPLYLCDIRLVSSDVGSSTVNFDIVDTGGAVLGEFALKVGGSTGYELTRKSAHAVEIEIGSKRYDLAEYFSDYTPLIRFVDLSELDGNLLLKPTNAADLKLSKGTLLPWDWTGIDITKESIWDGSVEHPNTVQWAAAEWCKREGFELIFDDDGAGEAADLVCMKEEVDHIRLALIHCKFSADAKAGARIKDVVEVSSQAIRSAKWGGRFRELCRHLIKRHDRRAKSGRVLLIQGSLQTIGKFAKAARTKEVRTEILIVQPGVSIAKLSRDQEMVLGAAASYLKETLGIDIQVACES